MDNVIGTPLTITQTLLPSPGFLSQVVLSLKECLSWEGLQKAWSRTGSVTSAQHTTQTMSAGRKKLLVCLPVVLKTRC